MQEKSKLLGMKYEMEKEHNELALKLTKAQTELEYERKMSR